MLGFECGSSGFNSIGPYIFLGVLCACPRASATVIPCKYFVATNDSAVLTSYQHVPVDEYADSLSKLNEFDRSLNITSILVKPPQALAPDQPHHNFAKYANDCKSVAQSTETTLSDLHTGFLAIAETGGFDAIFVDDLLFPFEIHNTI